MERLVLLYWERYFLYIFPICTPAINIITLDQPDREHLKCEYSMWLYNCIMQELVRVIKEWFFSISCANMKEHKDLSRNNQNKPFWIREPIVSHLQASLSYWFCRDFRYYMLELDLSRQNDMSKLLTMQFNQEISV